MPAAEKYPQVSFRLGELASIVDARVHHEIDNASRSHAVRVMLSRYDAICRADLPPLTPSEWNLCADVLNGVWLQDFAEASGERLRFVWAEVADACRGNGAHTKWKIENPAALVEKIRGLTMGQLVAFVDRIERFWGRDEPLPGET